MASALANACYAILQPMAKCLLIYWVKALSVMTAYYVTVPRQSSMSNPCTNGCGFLLPMPGQSINLRYLMNFHRYHFVVDVMDRLTSSTLNVT